MLQSYRIFCVINVIKYLGLQQLLSYKSQNQIADFQSECLVKLSKLTPTIYSFFNSREKYYLNKNNYYYITGLQKAVLILF